MSGRSAPSDALWRVLTDAGDPFSQSAAKDTPAICANMVMSVDGATTIAGRVGALTSPADQRLLRRLRAEADAVLELAGHAACDDFVFLRYRRARR